MPSGPFVARRAWLFCSCVAASLLAACGGGSNVVNSGGGGNPTGPATNHAPVVGSIAVSPSGMGLVSVTTFTFTAQNVSDPDGDSLTYTWTTSDGDPAPSTTGVLSRAFARTGTFDARVTVTDSHGSSASATVSVTIGTLTGTWDIHCGNVTYPRFPTQFVVSMTQDKSQVTGTISANGITQTFPSPGTSFPESVRHPRHVMFGVETFFNRWADFDGDFYFNLDAGDDLRTMTGSARYCGDPTATKR